MAEYRVNDTEENNVKKTVEDVEDKILLKDSPDFIKGKKEINEKLAELLAMLEQKPHALNSSVDTASTNSIDGKSDDDNKDNFQLLQQVRIAYCNSIYGNRSYDATGKVDKFFGFLTTPTKHIVSLQVNEGDIILKDGLSLAEQLGCMEFFNIFNFMYTILRFSVLLLVTPWLLILVPCIIAGLYTPDSDLESLFIILWNIMHLSNAIWMFAYIFCYGNIEAMKVILQANPIHAFWLIGSSVSYTVSSILYSPTLYNVPAVINMSLVMTLHKFLFGSTIVFFKLRTTRKNYEFYFVPKGWFAKLWLFLDSEEFIADILRHLAILYSVQASLEAQGKDVLDQESLVGLTIAGKAFQVTLRQVMNTSYTVSLIFRFSGILQGIIKSDLGKRFPNLPRKKIVNIE